MTRRTLLGSIASMPLALAAGPVRAAPAPWPKPAPWAALSRRVGGRLQPVAAPNLATQTADRLANPFYRGDEPALTQSAGWVDAWQSAPSAFVVTARDAADVAEAVRFAGAHNVRLTVKGGGHSYLGGSSAAQSLLVWTRAMNRITLHDGFVPQGAAELPAQATPVPAVSVGAGCTWGHVYAAVTTRGGRYVQGGGCTTVGVAGLVQGGGFGSFSKAYGLAAASLLEAEIVTADGTARIVNAYRDADLFWALKGGGGGTFGVVTRLTLQTHALPATFGGAFMTIQATTEPAFRALLARFLAHYRDHLCNEHWGEQARATHDNKLVVQMVFQGLDTAAARAAWQDFQHFVAADPHAFQVEKPLIVMAMPARHFWDPAYLENLHAGLVARDDRPGASPDNWWWRGDGEQAGTMWHGYGSLWLPENLLHGAALARLAQAWFEASRDWSVALHFNKGLAGGNPAALAASRNTAMNPQVLEAFALAIIAGNGPPLLTPADLQDARANAASIAKSMATLRKIAPDGGSYLSECDYFLANWQAASWGHNVARLDAIKRRYDPDNVFYVHHGVGSGNRL